MMRKFLFTALLCGSIAAVQAQQLPARWDELTATDWPKALAQSDSTCILPFGILEKHGPHVPIGSDLIQVHEWSNMAVKQSYAVIFPDYLFGQINEAKHQPGAFALPERVTWDLLEATCDEIGRNGFKKIVIINGHGGNVALIRYFVQTRLSKRRNYAVYFFEPSEDSVYRKKFNALYHSQGQDDGHAGEAETSTILDMRPDLVKMDHAKDESGKAQKRLQLPNLYTAIWWYADFPNHYAGDGSKATKALGQLIDEHYVSQLVQALNLIKKDTETLKLQNEFFDRVKEH
ncbi:MAG: creatininase family protein [Mucilaginibacter sp.]